MLIKILFNVTYVMDVLIAVVAVLVVLSITIFLLSKQIIAVPVGRLGKGFGQVANGDLTTEMDVHSKDEIGELSGNFNSIVGRLRDMMGTIANQVDSLKSLSEKLKGLSVGMPGDAEDMSMKSNAVASSANEMSSNMSSVSESMAEANIGLFFKRAYCLCSPE